MEVISSPWVILLEDGAADRNESRQPGRVRAQLDAVRTRAPSKWGWVTWP